MGYKLVCDLCGKPLDYKSRNFKVKELKCLRDMCWWERIDVHDECLKKLLEAKREANIEEGEDGHTTLI